MVTQWACGNAVTGPSSNDVAIAGRVFTFTTRAPIASAIVRFLAEIGSEVGAATTNETGRFEITLPASGTYYVSVNGGPYSRLHTDGAVSRGDLLVDDSGKCVARYGMVTDARSRRPIVGATLAVGGVTAVTNSEGWYTTEFGCPDSGTIGFNTTLMTVSHRGYQTKQIGIGRGIQGVIRIDTTLEK